MSERNLGFSIAKFFIVLAAAVCLFGYFACIPYKPWHPSPGQGRKAERGFQAAKPLIFALNNYHSDHLAYPDALTDLIPDYISVVPIPSDDEKFLYETKDEQFSLTFRYFGPGVNTCIYATDTGWVCSGYY